MTVKKAEMRFNAKHAVLTLHMSLGAVEPDSIPEFARNFSQPVQYTLTVVDLQGATKQGSPGPLFGAVAGATPQGAQGMQVRVGEIATAAHVGDDGPEEVTGRVVSVAGGRVVLHRWLDGTAPVDVALADVLSTTPIAGPNGGDPEDAIGKLLDTGAEADIVPEPAHLLQALMEVYVDGGQECPAEGWHITAEVRDRALQIAAEDDLPAEA